MATEILWINHAGYELRVGGLRIVHDPWLTGRAFGDGWALVSPTRYRGEDFAGVDYIWFSHEHPDHFSPPSLKQIPEPLRPSITVLFQETRDRRVIEFCRKLGFNTRELPDRQPVALNDVVTVTCGQVIGRDSWLHVQGPDVSIFNANDCVPGEWKDVAQLLGKPPDVLLTQFSYANWTGNPGDAAKMKRAADVKIGEMRAQIETFKPKVLIPCASFVWFCREDNFHLNEHANRIDQVERLFRNDANIVVLYPGDCYAVGEAHDNGPAIRQYLADWATLKPLDHEDKVVPLAELQELSAKEQGRLKRNNRMAFLMPLKWFGYVQPIGIYLRDLQQGVSYSMFGGLLRVGLPRSECDIELTSASFAAMLRNGYGYGTLTVNGRYLELREGSGTKLSRHFAIAARNEEGEFVPGIFFKRDYVASHLKRLVGR